MMNFTKLLVFMFAATSVAALMPEKAFARNVSADTLRLGYCDGQSKAENDIVFDNVKKVSTCICLPQSTVSHYAGNQLQAVDYYVISKLRTDSIRVWVRSSLDGKELCSTVVSKSKLVKGWNRAAFGSPVTLAAQDYYIGYTYYQSTPTYVISTVGNDCAGALYIQQGDSAWSDRSAEGHGALVVEALVAGNKLPQYDARLESASMERDSLKIGFPVSVSGIVKNVAAHPFRHLTIACTSDGMKPMTFAVDVDSTISYREQALFHFSFVPDFKVQTENIKLSFTVTDEDGNADDDVDNAKADMTYNVMNNLFTRKAFVEEFSTEKCVYCPGAAARLTKALSEDNNSKHCVAIIRHSGFMTDNFTKNVDDTLQMFYSIDYAPAYMFDRTKQGSDYFYNLTDYNDLKGLMRSEAAKGTDIEMNTFAYFNATGDTVNVEVYGVRNDNFNVEKPLITVSLVENNVLAVHQRGADGNKIEGYRHNHVVRAYNSVWGDALTFDGNAYDYKCKFPVDRDTFVVNNMYIAAFIDVHGNSREDNHVYNADQFELKYASDVNYIQTTGIEEASDNAELLHVGYADGRIVVEGACKSYSVFALDGRTVENGAVKHGVYLVRAMMNDGSVKTRKLFVK